MAAISLILTARAARFSSHKWCPFPGFRITRAWSCLASLEWARPQRWSRSGKRSNDRIADDGRIPLWKDLNVFASDVTLRQKLFDSEGFTSWATGTHTLHLFLDSLDECLLRIETIVPLLLDELRNKDLGRLRLRIACRTAEWPAALENGLKSLYNDGLQIFELAPLRKRDVAEAARCSSLDPEAFLAQVDQREAVPFAIKPVTLKMLLKMSKQGEFPSSLADL